MTTRSNLELVDVVDDVLGTALSLARDINEREADLPTECPGWTVRDQLAHMVGLEQVLGGAPAPDVELPSLGHVESELDAFMERIVHVRRGLPLVAIADELAGMRSRRIADLRLAAQQGDPLVAGPVGERPLSAALPVRVFDLWAHEQDIRRAIGLPVRIDCPAADIALDRSIAAWSSALPQAAEGVDGVLVVRAAGSELAETRIQLGDGGDAWAVLAGDAGELTRLFCGRTPATPAHLSGDVGIVDAVTGRLAMTP